LNNINFLGNSSKNRDSGSKYDDNAIKTEIHRNELYAQKNVDQSSLCSTTASMETFKDLQKYLSV